MAALLLRLKGYLWAFGALALSGVVVFARIAFLKGQRDKFKNAAERATVQAHRAKVIADRDNEIEGQTRSRRAEAANELKETGTSESLTNPGSLWDDPDR